MRNAHYQLMNYINMSKENDVYYYAAVSILKNIKKVPYCSITQIADMCYASTATISRLIRRLNYATYNDFKQDVIYSQEEVDRCDPIHFDQEPVESFPNVSYRALKDDYVQSVIDNLKFTHEQVSEQDIREVVQDIERAKRVIFLGFNFCQMVSSQLQSTLAIDNKIVLAKTSEKLQLELLQESTKDDLIILTTITGNYFQYKPEATSYFEKSPASKIVITQAVEVARAHHANKVIPVGQENISYIGKFSVMMIFEMIEMFYIASHIEG